MKKNCLPFLSLLVFLLLATGCGNSARKEYKEFISSGLNLEEGKSLEARVGDKVFLTNSHPGGVEPAYSDIEVIIDPPGILKFIEEKTFVFEPDQDGGPQTDVMIYSALTPGKVTVKTYSVFENRESYEEEFNTISATLMEHLKADVDSLVQLVNSDMIEEEELELFLTRMAQDYAHNPVAFQALDNEFSLGPTADIWENVVPAITVKEVPHEDIDYTIYTLEVMPQD